MYWNDDIFKPVCWQVLLLLWLCTEQGWILKTDIQLTDVDVNTNINMTSLSGLSAKSRPLALRDFLCALIRLTYWRTTVKLKNISAEKRAERESCEKKNKYWNFSKLIFSTFIYIMNVVNKLEIYASIKESIGWFPG